MVPELLCDIYELVKVRAGLQPANFLETAQVGTLLGWRTGVIAYTDPSTGNPNEDPTRKSGGGSPVLPPPQG